MPLIYTANVPQASDQINNTQSPIEQNFEYIYDLIGVNHVNFNTANDFGKHNFVTYYNQTTEPTPGDDEIIIFSQETSSGTQLYYKYPNDTTVYSITGSSTSGSTASGTGYCSVNNTALNAFGYQYLAGSLSMQFSNTFTFPNSGSLTTPYSGTYTFKYTSFGMQGFTTAVYHLEVMPRTLTGTSPSGSSTVTYQSQGTVQATIIDKDSFSITINNGYGGYMQVLAIGV